MDEVNNDKKNKEDVEVNNSQEKGLFIFFRLNILIFGPLVLGVVLGKWLNARYEMEPWGLFWSLIGAFIVSVLAIFIEYKRLVK